MRLRWLVLGVVLTLALGVATYSYQEAQAIYPIKGYVSAGGTQVEVKIENGTTTTTSPETKPAPEPEKCDQGDTDCKQVEEEERERYKEGQESAKDIADTVKEKVTETVKGTAKQIDDEVDKTVTDAINNATDSDLPPCRNTACMLERKHQAEVDAYNKAQQNVIDEINDIVNQTTTELPPCKTTACMMERKHQAELDEFYGVTKNSKTTVFPQQIIVLNLSHGCERSLAQNVSSVCLTYKDLVQFDNTDKRISGEFFTDENGYFHRGETKYESHCNYYLPEIYPVVIAVDGDNCWIKERGAMLITVNAITTENFQFKISDSFDVERLRDIQKQDTRILNDEQEFQDDVDRLEKLLEQRDDTIEDMEDELKDFDEATRDLYEEVGQNPDMVKVRDQEREDIIAKFSNRSIDRQVRAWETELREAQADLDEVLAEKRDLQIEQRDIKSKTSGVTTNSTITFGLGRSVDECRTAQIGSDIDMVTDTVNYLLDNCENSPTSFDNTMVIELEESTIDLRTSPNWTYSQWFAQVAKDCLGLCKEY